MADSDLSITFDTTNGGEVLVAPPTFALYESETQAHKRYVMRNAREPLRLYRCTFKALTAADYATLKEHYNTNGGSYQAFAWTSVPSNVREYRHAKCLWALDGAAYTDETADGSDDGADDMTLLPAVPAVNDCYYFGSDGLFNGIKLRQTTQGAGTWTITWEYYNGAWGALAGVTDNTTGFTAAAGKNTVTWTQPTDWATLAVNGVTAYWARARVSAYVSVTTQPLGGQVWLNAEPYMVQYYDAIEPKVEGVGYNRYRVEFWLREYVN